VILALDLQFHSRVPPHVLGESDSSATHLLSGKQFHSLSSQLICFGIQKTVSLFRFSTHLHWSSESSFTLWILHSFALVSRKWFHSSGSQLICIGVQIAVSLSGSSTHLVWCPADSFTLQVLNSFALEFRKQIQSLGSQFLCLGVQKKVITLQDLSSFDLDFRKPVSFFSFSIFLLGLQKTVSLFRFLTQCFWSSENIFTLWVLKSFVSEFTK
jgi:hypothetical protein